MEGDDDPVVVGKGSASVSVSDDDVESIDDVLVLLNKFLNLSTLNRGGGFCSHSAGG